MISEFLADDAIFSKLANVLAHAAYSAQENIVSINTLKNNYY